MNTQLPVVLQGEVAECGLSCLCMLLRHQGVNVELAELREHYSNGLLGHTLGQLAEVAAAYGFTAEPGALHDGALDDVPLPAIALLAAGHFVVLERLDGESSHYIDPARGRTASSQRQFLRSFTGFFLAIHPKHNIKKSLGKSDSVIASIRASLGRIDGLRRAFTNIIFIAVALEIITIGLPSLVQWITDDVLPAHDFGLLGIICGVFLTLVVVQATLSFFRSWSIMHISAGVFAQWAQRIFSHLVRLPLRYFGLRQIGDVVSRFKSADQIYSTIASGMLEAFIDGLLVITAFTVMAIYSWRLALLSFAVAAAFSMVRLTVNKKIISSSRLMAEAAGQEQSQLIETVRSIQTIKALGIEPVRYSGWVEAFHQSLAARVRIQGLGISLQVAQVTVLGVETVCIFWMGAGEVLNGTISLGMLFAYMAYKATFLTRGFSLLDKIMAVRALTVHVDRLDDIVKEPIADTVCAPGPLRDMDRPPSLELQRVGFRYARTSEWVFRTVSLKIEPGEHVAIVGPSGCGKTTLLRAVLGFIDITEGLIKLEGEPAIGWELFRLNNLVGSVLQDDVLFTGSIGDNIARFAPSASEEKILACADCVQIGQFIRSLPMGIKTILGEGGLGLSAGQRQRVILARALYAEPKLLILDEATSHLDRDTEEKVIRSICNRNVTLLTVSHRAEIVDIADRIVRFSDLLGAPSASETEYSMERVQ